MWKILLLLSVVGCRCLVWNNLKVMEEVFGEFKDAGNEVMSSVNLQLSRINRELEKFISEFDKNALFKSFESLPEVKSCPENNFDFEIFKKSFRIQLIQLSLPVSHTLELLKEQFTEIEASLATYRSLANSRWWACKFKGSDCTQDVENWLSSKLSSLSCQISSDCLVHKILKRSPQWNLKELEPLTSLDHKIICPDGSWIDRSSFDRGFVTCPPSTTEAPICFGMFNCHPEIKRHSIAFSYDGCVELSKVCDGNFDCSDGSDETGCTSELSSKPRNCSLDFGEFLCKNKKCVVLSEVCDGLDSCGDGSDEGGQCGVGSCDGNCNEGVCFRGPNGPLCLSRCPPGTYESPSGCTSWAFSSKSTLRELLDDLSSLLNRQIKAHYSLKRKASDVIAKYLDEAARCRGGYFASIGGIYQIKSFNKIPFLYTSTVASTTSSS